MVDFDLDEKSIIVLMYIVAILVACLLGKFKCYRAQALLCNITVILPCNIVVVGLYYVLTPLRFVYSRTCNFLTTPFISLFMINPTWRVGKETSFLKIEIVTLRQSRLNLFPSPILYTRKQALANSWMPLILATKDAFARRYQL